MKIVTSGIKGLDDILEGGFIRPSSVLIAGTAGTGKTIFAMQGLFNAAKGGEEICLFLPAISEPIAMINNFMSNFTFYDPKLYEEKRIHFFDLSSIILKKRPSDVLSEIEDKIETIKPDRVVIDPINPLAYGLEEGERRKFFYDLFTGMKGWNSTVLITGEFTEESLHRSDMGYIVDGIIYLSNEAERDRRIRYLDVLKLRGQRYSSEKHTFKITGDGIIVFPKLRPSMRAPLTMERISTGIKGLDLMTNGGLLRGMSTMISGGGGTGKTVFGLHFIMAGAEKDEPGVIVSFEETPEQLRANAMEFGWDLKGLEEKDMLRIIYTPVAELYPDEHALLIKKAIDEIGAKRVLIDSVSEFKGALLEHGRLREHVHLLSDYFKANNITAMFTNEISDLMGSLTVTGTGTSYIMDSVIVLRYVEIESQMKRAVSVLKMRSSNHSKEIREFEIGDKGVEIKMPFKEYEGLMSGAPTKYRLELERLSALFGEEVAKKIVKE